MVKKVVRVCRLTGWA